MATLRRIQFPLFLIAIGLFYQSPALSQEEEEDAETEQIIEEVVVTGSQIRGADISGLVPVTVLSTEDVDAMGVDSGDELLEMLPEQGQNFFNEEENISGGVNSARGDVGAFNLRNLGTGNTLVLLNGRRMVNAAAYQTEEVGGSFVPVNTVNSNTLPVFGIERVEILKDGASAIYGADAVAGVVNTVLKSDIEGFRIKTRAGTYQDLSRNSYEVNVEWGRYFNDGATNLGVMADFQARGRISAHEDERWADADFRRRVPEGSLWEDNTNFRNNSANGLFGQFDVRSSVSGLDIRGPVTDGSGEFEVYPAGHERCVYRINNQVCGAPDGQGTFRYNLNEFRDLSGELTRNNVLAFLNHDFSDTLSSYSELMYYQSESHINRHPSASFSSIKLRVAADNYYNPLGPCGSPNRLPESVIGDDVPCSGLELEIDNYRFAELPRSVSVDGTVFRVLQGLRGERGNWDWDTAVVWSMAQRLDLTGNRVSNLLMTEALNDPTASAYNAFSGGVNSNIERALIDVTRENDAGLFMWDVKFSNSNFFEMPAGSVGALIGYEHRREWFKDDRDPRLDGTIVFTDHQGDTYPFVSDVINSSPTPDNDGSRRVDSLFAELAIPLMDRVDAQVALRFENFSDVDNAVVPKFAIGWQVTDQVGLRASLSEAFRVPNLVTVNEDIVARQNTRNDYACIYAANEGGDPDQDTLDCRNSIQRTAVGSDLLVPETSQNISVGAVLDVFEGVTLTADYWSIVKEDTIGLFGEENHTVLDLVARIQQGNSNCDALISNPAVIRLAVEEDAAAVWEAAGLCPAGETIRVNDQYRNLDTRTLRGFDVGVYWETDTDFGRFNVRYLASFLREFEQEGAGNVATLIEAKNSGLLPAYIPVMGFDDLVQKDGNQKYKGTLLVTWRNDPWGGALSQTTIGDVYQDHLTIEQDGQDTRYFLGSMTTWNLRADYRFEINDIPSRVRFGIRNVLDERAPLADRYFGFMADVHRDYGRYFYTDLLLTFD